MALKRCVDELSDDEACKDACNVGEYCLGADLTTDDWDTFKYSLRAPCPCALRRQIQDQSCYDVFQKNNALQEELRRERAHFKSMHKLDQDRLLFDKLRELAYSQGILVRNELGKLAVQGTLKYFFLGQPICRLGFAHLYGVGWAPRLTTIYMMQSLLAPAPLQWTSAFYLVNILHLPVRPIQLARCIRIWWNFGTL